MLAQLLSAMGVGGFAVITFRVEPNVAKLTSTSNVKVHEKFHRLSGFDGPLALVKMANESLTAP